MARPGGWICLALLGACLSSCMQSVSAEGGPRCSEAPELEDTAAFDTSGGDSRQSACDYSPSEHTWFKYTAAEAGALTIAAVQNASYVDYEDTVRYYYGTPYTIGFWDSCAAIWETKCADNFDGCYGYSDCDVRDAGLCMQVASGQTIYIAIGDGEGYSEGTVFATLDTGGRCRPQYVYWPELGILLLGGGLVLGIIVYGCLGWCRKRRANPMVLNTVLGRGNLTDPIFIANLAFLPNSPDPNAAAIFMSATPNLYICDTQGFWASVRDKLVMLCIQALCLSVWITFWEFGYQIGPSLAYPVAILAFVITFGLPVYLRYYHNKDGTKERGPVVVRGWRLVDGTPFQYIALSSNLVPVPAGHGGFAETEFSSEKGTWQQRLSFWRSGRNFLGVAGIPVKVGVGSVPGVDAEPMVVALKKLQAAFQAGARGPAAPPLALGQIPFGSVGMGNPFGFGGPSVSMSSMSVGSVSPAGGVGFCTQCGSSRGDVNDLFCGKCGNQFAAPAAEAPATPPPYGKLTDKATEFA